jgi:hypothetical protein
LLTFVGLFKVVVLYGRVRAGAGDASKWCSSTTLFTSVFKKSYKTILIAVTSIARILGPFWREKIRGFCRKSAPPYFNVHEFTMLVGLW